MIHTSKDLPVWTKLVKVRYYYTTGSNCTCSCGYFLGLFLMREVG